jgi:predicted DNA-binding protein with PD1-like motif
MLKIAALSASMVMHVIRLHPGEDLKKSIETFVQERQIKAAMVVTTVGSLNQVTLRFANQPKGTDVKGPLEIVSLVGTLSSAASSHLHLSVSDGTGKTVGGHLMDGSSVYTTAEIGIAELKDKEFKRVLDPKSGYPELAW